MNIAFIGNFEPSFSTENDRAKSFNRLGHTVFALQENRATKADLEKLLFKPKKGQEIDLLMYSHTHGWEIPGLVEVFKECKIHGIPTVSAHLDRWVWLDREKDIGQEATWFTDHVFMADASPEAVEIYNNLGINWHYLKPGVLAEECVMIPPDKVKYPYEIVFIGSKGYHREYPFRLKLVNRLKAQFGQNFAHYGSDGLGVVRGLELNKIMASAKIVVGDSCFGGRPNYVSDRYYETRGRGGFLMHPHTAGHDAEGVGHYNAMDVNDLTNQINFFLNHDKDREQMRIKGFEHVRDNETYVNRAHEMLTEIFGEQPPIPKEEV